jgi:hypothetical protein
MASRIRELTIRANRLTPTEAELAIELQCPLPKPTTELRGRLLGPSCPYSTTVEVAYPIRRTRPHAHGSEIFHGQVVIPEPAWWDPESPFLYHGPIELWEHEHKVEEVRVRIGLRHATWQDERLIWNGRPIPVASEPTGHVDEVAFKTLRAAGKNAIVVPAVLAESACEIGDRIGLLVISDPPQFIPGIQHPSAVPPRAA